ncbi:hypothetical protein U9M48_006766 [Paspalum notatum var. saurae]|uniref:Uncharacterized protein n=1 Tax=Paspalum notatum var. saurae TaxID=547442 RepID=A0AAQ3SGH0_PASNO
MTMPWGVAARIVDMVWAVLAGWVSTCLIIANEVGHRLGSSLPLWLCGFLLIMLLVLKIRKLAAEAAEIATPEHN